ncbi:hypothetical protein ACSNOI_42830 [Actinomadura kijaniata]|uniref:hypothetical protein n=1 Tax=Actinomadura kijaniata TaxID=46161 RepID=UPI003F1975C1
MKRATVNHRIRALTRRMAALHAFMIDIPQTDLTARLGRTRLPGGEWQRSALVPHLQELVAY